MTTSSVKFATRVDDALLAALQAMAEREKRPLHTMVNEALADPMPKRENTAARPHVMAAYRTSHKPYAPVYKKLAE